MQVSAFLRRGTDAYYHWCPGCGKVHQLPDTWQFNGDLNKPTFSPSFRHSGKWALVDDKGKFTGEWKRDPDGKALDWCCHYILTNGVLNFCGDCTHEMRSQKVPLPELPEWLKD